MQSETRVLNAAELRDTTIAYSPVFTFGQRGYGNGVLIVENTLDQAVTVRLQGRAHEGSTWQDIGAGISVAATTGVGYIPISSPWSILRMSYIAGTTPTSGSLTAWFDMAKAGSAGLDLSSDTIKVALSLDTNAYVTGDVLADTQEVAGAMRVPMGTGVWQSLVVLDKDDNGIALDIVLLRSDVSIGTENVAVSVTDADADEILGTVEVAATDYVDLINSQLATKPNLGIVVSALAGETSLWVAAIIRGAGTYTVNGITLLLGFLRD